MHLSRVIQDQYKLLTKIKKHKHIIHNYYSIFVKKCLKYLHEAVPFIVPSYDELRGVFADESNKYYLFEDSDAISPFESCYFCESNTPNYRNLYNNIGSSLIVRLQDNLYGIITYTYSKLYDVIAPAHQLIIVSPGQRYYHSDYPESILTKLLTTKCQLIDDAETHNSSIGYYLIGGDKGPISLFLQNPDKVIDINENNKEMVTSELNSSIERLFLIIAGEHTKVDAMLKLFAMRNVKTIDYIPPTGETHPRTGNRGETHDYKMIVRELTPAERKRYGRREDYVYAPLEFNKNGQHKRCEHYRKYGAKYGRGLLFGKYECKVLIPETTVGRNKTLIIDHEYRIV